MRTRHQRGHIFPKGRAWYLRYYENVMEADNAVVRKQVCRKLADFSDRYRSKRDVRPLAEEFLRPLNAGRVGPQSTLPMTKYVDDYYLPNAKDKKRPSTYKEYRRMWRCYLHDRLTKITLRDFRCSDGDRLLEEIAARHQLSRTTFYHLKSFVSGVFKFAKRQGVLDGPNPMQDVSVPETATPPRKTYAYTLEEIQRMLHELPEPAKTVVATAAYTGLRKSEIRGLRWDDYRDCALYVSRSVWRSYELPTKTDHSEAAVPVISILAQMLDRQRQTSGPIFRARTGKPLNLDNLADRVIIPSMNMARLKWRGWHAFRRGLATNLHRLGVDDKTIQAILRHSSLSTTQSIYIKTVSSDAEAAMEKLRKAMENVRPN